MKEETGDCCVFCSYGTNKCSNDANRFIRLLLELTMRVPVQTSDPSRSPSSPRDERCRSDSLHDGR